MNKDTTRLHRACRNGKLDEIKMLLQDEAWYSSINNKIGAFGYTPLHEAVYARKNEVVKLLLDFGADVNSRSDGNYTALHIAASLDARDCIEVLLENKADTNLLDDFNRTPYRTAKMNNRGFSSCLLYSADVLNSLKEDRFEEFYKYLKNIKPEKVTLDCFEKCLKVAIEKDNCAAVGMLMLQKPRNAKECLSNALKKQDCHKSTLLLLLCYAVEKHYNDVIRSICEKDDLESTELGIDQWSKFYEQFSIESLGLLRSYVDEIKEYFVYPIRIGCRPLVKNYEGVKVILSSIFCDKDKLIANWGELGLTCFHEEFQKECMNGEIKNVCLRYNSIESISSNNITWYLSSVEKLNLTSNKLKEIPPELFNLPRLRNLNLSSNKLKYLPNVKEWSPYFTTLSLDNNLLESFPSNVDRVPIKNLYISNNKLDSIPEGICNLKYLETLKISGNSNIRVFPVSMGNLTKLRQLDKTGIKIYSPSAIRNLDKTKDIMSYLMALKRSAVPYYTMKLMIIGFAEQGKTTLLKRLQENTSYNENRPTEGIDIQDVSIGFGLKKSFNFRVWDFAGQEEYFATHQCFLSSSSLYLLVWDVTKKNQCTQLIKPWLENLIARVEIFYVIIVATKLDLLSEDIDAVREKMTKKIKEILEKDPSIKSLRSKDEHFSSRVKLSFVSLNPSFRNFNKSIDELKTQIYLLAESMTLDGKPGGSRIMGMMVPQSYQKLEAEIIKIRNMKEKNGEIPIISRAEFILIGKSLKCNADKFEDDDLEAATKVLLDTGTILHFDGATEGLNDIIFLSPSWVCKLMAKFITVDCVHAFIKNGILERKNIPLILGKDYGSENPETIKKYLRLLWRFQIACEIDDNRILVPSKLPVCAPQHASIDLTSLLTRYYFFNSVPYGFWARLITRFLFITKEMLSNPKIEIEPKDSLVDSIQKGKFNSPTFNDAAKKYSNINDTLSLNIESSEDSLCKNQVLINSQLSKSKKKTFSVNNCLINSSLESLSSNSDIQNDSKYSNLHSEPFENTDLHSLSSLNSAVSAGLSLVSSDDQDVGPSSPDQDVGPSSPSNIEQDCNIYSYKLNQSDHIANISLPIMDNSTHVENKRNNLRHYEYDVMNVLQELLDRVVLEANTNKDNFFCISTGNIEKQNETNNNNPTDSTIEIKFNKNCESDPEKVVEQGCNEVIVNKLIQNNDDYRYENVKILTDCNKDSEDVRIQTDCTKDSDDVKIQTDCNKDSENLKIQTDCNKESEDAKIQTDCNKDLENLKIQTDCNKDSENVKIQTNRNRYSEDVKIQTDCNRDTKDEQQKLKEDEINAQLIDELSSEDKAYEEYFNDCNELAYLLDNRYLSFWNEGIIFNHPQLYFSIQQLLISVKPDQATIEIRVSKSLLGYRVLSYIVDHIRTLLEEWYEGLMCSNTVVSSLACPVCTSLGVNQPFLFNISTAFEKIYKCSEDNICKVICERCHVPKTVNIADFCPDLNFQDLPKTMKLNYSDIQCEQNEKCKLGEGDFGKVYSGLYKNQIKAAIKFYTVKMSNSDDLLMALNQFYEIRREIVMLSKLRHHPYIIQFLGFSMKPELCAVMECARRGSLSSVIHKRKEVISRIVKFRICQQIASALAFMHKKYIIHRDIKSDNILLFSLKHDAKINVKLTDFGTANFMSPCGMKMYFGTKGYSAPEIISHRTTLDEYSSSIDIYSFGIVLYELITYRRPFHDAVEVYEIDDSVKNGFRPKFYDVPEALYGLVHLTKLMISMWHQEPFKRPHAKEILNILLSPTFQLVFGVKTLSLSGDERLSIHNPRDLCYVKENNQIWIACDDKEGLYIIVIDMEIFRIVKKIKIDTSEFNQNSFNISSITSIGDKHVCIVLRSLDDILLVYKVKKYSVFKMHVIEDHHVVSISASSKWVYLGFYDGRCSKIKLKDFLKSNLLDNLDDFQLYSSRFPIISLVLFPETVIWSVGRSIAYCNLKKDEEGIKEEGIKPCHMERNVQEIVHSFDRKTFFISFQSSPEIYLHSGETKEALHTFSCRDDILLCSPEALNVDLRVTCMCSVDNMLWVGTGSGHILIYEVHTKNYKTILLQTLHPYTIELRKLELIPNLSHADVKYLIVSTGKELNKYAFGMNTFFNFNGYVPKDDTAVSKKLYQPENTVENDGKVILVWHVLPSDQYKNLVLR